MTRAMAGGLVALALLLACTRACAVAAAPAHVDPALRKALTQAVSQSSGFRNRFAAEVWLLDMSTRLAPEMPDTNRRLTLLRMVHDEALRAGLDPQLVLALIEVESRFQRFAISSAGARGLMQVMPFWTREIGRPGDNLFNIRTNLRYGCTILAHYLKIEHGNLTRALARYNGSLGRYDYPVRVETTLRKNWAVR